MALIAAIDWRNRRLAETQILTRREFCQQRRSNNTSGAPGVHFIKSPKQPLGSWQARVKLPNGTRVHRTFSVRRFGETEAFQRAVAARAELIQMIDDQPYLTHPTAMRLTRPAISR